MSLVADVKQKAGRFASSYAATLEGMSILFKDFPYPVEDVRGTLDFKDEHQMGDGQWMAFETGTAKPMTTSGKTKSAMATK